jgi:hypothetical protein
MSLHRIVQTEYPGPEIAVDGILPSSRCGSPLPLREVAFALVHPSAYDARLRRGSGRGPTS